MTVRLLAVADLHLGPTHLCGLEDQERALDAILDICRERDIRLVAIGGDLFNRNRPDPPTLVVAGHFFERLATAGITAVMSKGNHDPDAADIAQYFRGTVVVPSEPSVWQPDGGPDIAILPYLPDAHVRAQHDGRATKEEIAHLLTQAAHEILEGFLARRRPGVPLVFLGHGTVAGSETSTGYSMGFRGGTEWRLAVEDLVRFDLAIAGHVHRHQSPAPNVVVPGSLLPLDFSETEPKGVIVAELAGAVSWEHVRTPAPRVATWMLNDDQVATWIADGLLSGDLTMPDLLRIHISCTEATAREFPAAWISEAMYAAGARLVQVAYDIARASRTRDVGMTADLGPAAALGRYLASREDIEPDQRARLQQHAAAVLNEREDATDHTGGGDVELLGVAVTDFLGVREASVRFDSGDVAALVGPNGAGKSAIGIDALRFGLFGSSRAGARASERVIRHGSDLASVALSLRTADGHLIDVVRKVKRGSRGATSTLDVLERNGMGPRALSSGKLADGQVVVDALLGGLDDAALVASSLVPQRAADAFTRARPEDRKHMLARIGGLRAYDELAERTRERLRVAERETTQLEARAAGLRERVLTIPALEAEHILAAADRASAEAEALAVAARCEEIAAALDRERARAQEYERASGDATRAKDEQTALEAELATWDQKRDAANRILAERAQLEAARAELDAVRARITALEAEQAQQLEQLQAVRAAEQEIRRLEASLRDLRVAREHVAAGLRREIQQGEAAQRRLDDASCCADEPACVFIDDARKTVARLRDLDKQLAAAGFPTADEKEFQERADRYELPDEPDTRATVSAIAAERAKVPDLERRTAVAEKIAKAEQILEEHASATTKLREQIAAKRARVGNLNQLLLGFAGSPVAAVVRLQLDQAEAGRQRDSAHAVQRGASERVAVLAGRLEQMSVDTLELAGVEEALHLGAADTAALSELASAWKACRVLVLESALIPQVEQIANEVLRRFPHGLQLRLVTQRERASRDGLAETLEIEVLGGKGELYEMCSGGEQTVLDFAAHVALAVVVSRRLGTRIRHLSCDEPEGLDEASRAAFAAAVQWIASEFGLRVLAISHHDDLIDALGGRRIDVVPGAEGSTVATA